MTGTPPPNLPPEPLYSNLQELANAEAEAEQRRREIGYRIDEYPAQTTSQPK